ncbi:hypothetical protein PAMA_012098 [Pampus argenteus]
MGAGEERRGEEVWEQERRGEEEVREQERRGEERRGEERSFLLQEEERGEGEEEEEEGSSIMEQFNPCLRNFIAMGKSYEKALTSEYTDRLFLFLSSSFFIPPVVQAEAQLTRHLLRCCYI